MNPFIFLSLSFTVIFNTVLAQKNNVIKKQAQEYSRAIVRRNYDKWISLMYPKELALRGGRDSFMNVQKRIEKSDSKTSAIIFGDPGKIVQFGKRLFCTINDTIHIAGNFNIIGYCRAVAMSEDNGKHWYFFDTDWALRNLFPEVEKKMPVISSIISSSRSSTPRVQVGRIGRGLFLTRFFLLFRW
jgi:hypothetical protein